MPTYNSHFLIMLGTTCEWIHETIQILRTKERWIIKRVENVRISNKSLHIIKLGFKINMKEKVGKNNGSNKNTHKVAMD